ncbi:duf1680 domain-containing protein [Xylariaceae sp. FL0255]|nr:duf1680 domain-containing protein [Xylariaceae sp. FL0255]
MAEGPISAGVWLDQAPVQTYFRYTLSALDQDISEIFPGSLAAAYRSSIDTLAKMTPSNMAKALVAFLLYAPSSSTNTSETVSLATDANSTATTLVQPAYQALPLGSIQPLGWLKDTLQLEADGLAGNLYDFWRYVHNSTWVGGTWEYSNLREATSNWWNGAVPLAFGSGDAKVKAQVEDFLNILLSTQQADGWLGPETTPETRGFWARSRIMSGLIGYAEADPTKTDQIVDAMHKYVGIMYSMLANNFTGLIPGPNDVYDPKGFGIARAFESHIPLQWLYENYPRNNSQIIWDIMNYMIEGSAMRDLDWRDYFVEGVYPEVVYAPQNQALSWLFYHGVNQAEGLRQPVVIYRMNHDASTLAQGRTALDLLSSYHRSLSGTIIADEFITDLNPNRGSEVCATAEMSYSLTWMYQFLGDNDIADWAEQNAYNAVPGTMSADWWSHQYVLQENQPWSQVLTEAPQMWTNVGNRGNVYGLEPNFPCCTANHPQGLSKFVAATWMRTADGGIAHGLLSPGTVTAGIGNDSSSQKVTIEADTEYPFGFDFQYTINADAPFNFYVRIPEWSTTQSNTPSNGVQALSSTNGLQGFKIPSGKSTIALTLGAEPRIETRANNTAGIYYGPLLYALALDTDDTTTQPPEEWDAAGPVPSFSTYEPYTVDHTMTPTSPWNVAIDTSQIKVVSSSTAGNSSTLASPIFSLGAPPIELRVAAVEIEWPTQFGTAANPPVDPVVNGTPFSARFVPFGSSRLHMAHLPVLSLSKVDL